MEEFTKRPKLTRPNQSSMSAAVLGHSASCLPRQKKTALKAHSRPVKHQFTSERQMHLSTMYSYTHAQHTAMIYTRALRGLNTRTDGLLQSKRT